ncbi:MAG: biotin transporter BioY [Euryarchaeota archaeon]|nr:biotin transporter BioY [Euryarchaeota archaeon]
MFLSEDARVNFFRWKYESGLVYKLALSLMFAGLTGMGAQLRLYLPFTPVPITGQVFFVLLSGMVLGRRYGALSMALYAGLGALGVPWFAGGAAGLEVLLGATGGYILGFILAAYLIGHYTHSYVASRSLASQLTLMFSGVAVIYLVGAVQLALVSGLSPAKALALGVLPFVPGDILKAIAAVAVGASVLPRSAYASERDARGGSGRIRVHLSGLAAILTAVFIAMFWLKLLTLESPGAGELLWYSATYSGAVLLSAASAVHLAKQGLSQG